MKLEDLSGFLENLVPTTVDLTEPLKKTLPILEADLRQAFANRRSQGGTPWAPRKDSLPHPLLQKSGDMFRAAIEAIASATVTPDSLTFNNAAYVPYTRYQDEGTRTIPPRPFKEISDSAQDKIIELIEAEVVKSIEK